MWENVEDGGHAFQVYLLSFQCLRLFINAGAPTDRKNLIGGFTPLHCACARDDVDMAQVLISAGASLEVEDTEDWRPLHYAADKGHLATVELLLGAGAQLNPQTIEGYVPMFYLIFLSYYLNQHLKLWIASARHN